MSSNPWSASTITNDGICATGGFNVGDSIVDATIPHYYDMTFSADGEKVGSLNLKTGEFTGNAKESAKLFWEETKNLGNRDKVRLEKVEKELKIYKSIYGEIGDRYEL